MAEIDLNFLAQQMERMLREMGSFHDELRVQGAMIGRLDATLAAVLEEQRATRAQIMRMNGRIARLEDAS